MNILEIKGYSLRSRIAKLANPEGEWKTINGRHVFIGKGQSLDDALKRSFEKQKDTEKSLRKREQEALTGRTSSDIDRKSLLKGMKGYVGPVGNGRYKFRSGSQALEARKRVGESWAKDGYKKVYEDAVEDIYKKDSRLLIVSGGGRNSPGIYIHKPVGDRLLELQKQFK